MSEESARLFAALELPASIREALVEWRSVALEDVSGLRLVQPGDLHVTLCFLGWRPVGELDEILGACRVVAGEPVAELRLAEPVWLPQRQPRVLAVELDDLSGGLAVVQSSLSLALQQGGWYVAEARRFRAHVTVARVAKGARARRGRLEPVPALGFEGSRVTLYRSRLGPGGARYEPLGTVSLGSVAGAVDPLSVVRRFYLAQAAAYAGAGFDEVAALLADDVVWHVPGRSRIAGEHRGRAAVLEYLELRRSITDATFRVSVHGVSMIGERVVQLAGGSASRNGRELSWETVGVFRVRAGQIAECWLVPFDQYAFDEIWG